MGEGQYSPEEIKQIYKNLGLTKEKENDSMKVARERLDQGFKNAAGKGSDPKADNGPRRY